MRARIYESLICENRALLPTLTGTGMDVRLVEALDGHNWVSATASARLCPGSFLTARLTADRPPGLFALLVRCRRDGARGLGWPADRWSQRDGTAGG